MLQSCKYYICNNCKYYNLHLTKYNSITKSITIKPSTPSLYTSILLYCVAIDTTQTGRKMGVTLVYVQITLHWCYFTLVIKLNWLIWNWNKIVLAISLSVPKSCKISPVRCNALFDVKFITWRQNMGFKTTMALIPLQAGPKLVKIISDVRAVRKVWKLPCHVQVRSDFQGKVTPK